LFQKRKRLAQDRVRICHRVVWDPSHHLPEYAKVEELLHLRLQRFQDWAVALMDLILLSSKKLGQRRLASASDSNFFDQDAFTRGITTVKS
jgi:hypothetical protein